MMYRAIIYRDDPETGDAAVDSDATEPCPTITDAIEAGRLLAKRRGQDQPGWLPSWGTVESGTIEPWIPEPGVHLTEWVPAMHQRELIFGPDWTDIDGHYEEDRP